MAESNGNRLWFLILASFGFTVLCFGYTFATNCKVDGAAIKITDEVVCNDRVRQASEKEILNGISDIKVSVADIKAIIAPLATQIIVNTKRLDRLESK